MIGVNDGGSRNMLLVLVVAFTCLMSLCVFVKALGISGRRASVFATHPSIEDRVAALERLQRGI